MSEALDMRSDTATHPSPGMRPAIVRVAVAVLASFSIAASFPCGAQAPRELSEEAYRITPTWDATAPPRVYVPKNIEDAFVELKKMLTPALIEDMKSGLESGMNRHHLGLGTWMRNYWVLGAGSRLREYFNGLGVTDPEEMSGIILNSFWRHLNKRPIEFEQRVAFSRAYRDMPLWKGRLGEVKDRTQLDLEVAVKSIGARSLLALVADFAGLNAIAGDELRNKRLQVSESAITVNRLLTRMAGDQGLAIRSHNGILMVGSSCRLERIAAIPDRTAYRERLFMSFQNVAAEGFLDIVAGFVGSPFDISAIGKDSLLTVRIVDKTARDHLAAVATVGGWEARPFGRGGIRMVPGRHRTKCAPTAAGARPKAEAEISMPLPALAPPRPCPGPAGAGCGFLERYELDELRLLGYIRWLPNPYLFAIIATSDGFVVHAGITDLMGKNRGRITQITKAGLVIDESIEGAGGGRKDRRTTINYR